jgi:hypothetical protein
MEIIRFRWQTQNGRGEAMVVRPGLEIDTEKGLRSPSQQVNLRVVESLYIK